MEEEEELGKECTCVISRDGAGRAQGICTSWLMAMRKREGKRRGARGNFGVIGLASARHSQCGRVLQVR